MCVFSSISKQSCFFFSFDVRKDTASVKRLLRWLLLSSWNRLNIKWISCQWLCRCLRVCGNLLWGKCALCHLCREGQAESLRGWTLRLCFSSESSDNSSQSAHYMRLHFQVSVFWAMQRIKPRLPFLGWLFSVCRIHSQVLHTKRKLLCRYDYICYIFYFISL